MNVKKIIAASTVTLVVATQAMTAISMAATTTANYPAEWNTAVQFMKDNGLSSTANSVSEYQPLATVSREAAAKFFVNFAKKFFNKQADTTKVCTFSDINEAQSWAVPYIIEACQMGLLHGADGKFMPKAQLTKLQFLTVLARIVKNNPSIQPTQAFNLMKQEGVTKAATLADTVRPVTRIELAILFQRAADKYAQQTQEQTNTNTQTNTDISSILGSILGGNEASTGTTETTSATTGTTETTSATTGTTETTSATTTEETGTNVAGENVLSVALDPATPKEQYVPGTGVDIKAMKFDLTAGSEDVTVKALTVKLEGMVAKDHITNVYLEDANGAIISNQREFGVDYTARLVLNNDLVIKAGTTVALYVALDVKGSVNELIQVSIPSASDVEASTTVDGQFPIKSDVIHTTSYTSETITFTPKLTDTNNTYYVGDTDKEVARFELSTTAEHQKDIDLKSVRLKLSSDSTIGSVDTDLDNLKLVVNGQNIAKSATIDGRYITFTTDYTIPYGENRTFYVYADVIGVQSPSGDTIKFWLDKTSDISALEEGTNAAVNVADSGVQVSMETNNIKEGDNLITKSSESPVSTNIPYDTNDIPVLVANVNVSNPMNVDKFDITFKATDPSNDIKNMKLYINDKLVDITSTYKATDTTGVYVAEFSYYGELKGSNKFTVKVDTTSTAHDGDTISDVTIDGNSFVDATYVNTDNVVNPSDINGSAIGGTFTITKPAFAAVSKVDGYAETDYMIAGATDFDVLGTQVQANNVGNLTINTITVDLTDGTGAPVTSGVYNNISSAKLVVDGKVVDTENVNGSTVTFNSLSIPVAKASTARFDILIDTTTNLAGQKVQFVIPVNGIVATDDSGNTVNNSTQVNGTVWDVIPSANLSMTLNSNSPVEQVVAANPNVETEVARFDFRPTYDNAQIQELLLTNVANGSTGDTEADSVINTVYLYDTNGNKLAEASLSNGYADFNLSTALNLPKNQTTTVVVKVKTNAINNLSTTNKAVKFAIATANGTQETRIISVSNGEKIALDTLPTANKIIFRKTLLTFANDPQTTTTLQGGGADNDAYLWNVTADAAGAAKIHEMRLDITLNSASGALYTGYQAQNAGYTLYINGVAANTSDVYFTGLTNTDGGTLQVVFTGNYANGYEVSAGSTVKFKLVAKVNGTVDTNDTLTTRLANDGTGTNATTVADAPATYSVLWSDEADQSTVTTATQDWFTDADLLSLPLSSQTLTK